jgi:hypothetical protein
MSAGFRPRRKADSLRDKAALRNDKGVDRVRGRRTSPLPFVIPTREAQFVQDVIFERILRLAGPEALRCFQPFRFRQLCLAAIDSPKALRFEEQGGTDVQRARTDAMSRAYA